MDDKEILKALQKPFEIDEIEWRIGAKNSDATKGIALAYISNRAIQKRLDEVCGVFGWRNEFREWKGKEQICGISIKTSDGEWITKWDGAGDTDIEGTKGGLSGAMKRAASQWGIGRYLYDIPNQWVRIKHLGGKNYKLDEVPKLPKWALPEFEKQNPDWSEETQEFTIPDNVQKCIKAFTEFSVSQADLENYLYKEAFMFDEQDIQSLKLIYSQFKKKLKVKEDFFNIAVNKSNKNGKAKELESKLGKD
jgi:hypothetical protein